MATGSVPTSCSPRSGPDDDPLSARRPEHPVAMHWPPGPSGANQHAVRMTAPLIWLPAAVVDDLSERAPAGRGDGPQRAIGRVAHAEKEGDVMIGGHAEDLAGKVLVADRGMAGADAQVGGGKHHGVGGLPEVVIVDEAGAVVVGLGDDER